MRGIIGKVNLLDGFRLSLALAMGIVMILSAVPTLSGMMADPEAGQLSS